MTGLLNRSLLLVVLAVQIGAMSASAAEEATAFSLIAVGNEQVPSHARDKVVQIISDRTEGSLKPDRWSIIYYDSTAKLKSVRVRFADGKAITIDNPPRLFQRLTDDSMPLNRNRMKIDSDKALAIALAHPDLSDVDLTGLQMTLRWERGVRVAWDVEFWAKKKVNPRKTTSIGSLVINAQDGKLIFNQLRKPRLYKD